MESLRRYAKLGRRGLFAVEDRLGAKAYPAKTLLI
jgi:hypothetical protein